MPGGMAPYTLEDVRRALDLPHFDGPAAQSRMIPVNRAGRRPADKPGPPRLGGVLLLLYQPAAELYLVLTRRREDLESHAGQVSLPGGRREEAETLVATALRETHEEIGIPPTAVTILGHLAPLYILPSDYEVHPFVAWYQEGTRPIFIPESREVAEIIEVPLRHLLDPATRREEPWQLYGQKIIVPYFAVGEHKVWGATAMMLSELVERLRTVGSGQ